MQHRQQGMTQEIAAAKSAISTRTARRINTLPRAKADRDWRTREDPGICPCLIDKNLM